MTTDSNFTINGLHQAGVELSNGLVHTASFKTGESWIRTRRLHNAGRKRYWKKAAGKGELHADSVAQLDGNDGAAGWRQGIGSSAALHENTG